MNQKMNNPTLVRTRFAPSPTGYLHIGGARTALFSWAYAKHFGGKCVLRIEDTDLERSTPESVQAIFDGLNWLGLRFDEGPFYQMQRMDRYRQVLQQLLDEGKAYYCYATKEELDQLREQQRAQGLKPRYDGRWRDSTATPPEGVPPVIRFKNPLDGEVVIKDLIKGDIVFKNAELDDLIIARSDGTPTYNFCVVIDDMDMQITHVIRGDDHVNNTPRQINILQALNAPIPFYGHVPMILGQDGERLSKRHGAVSVMQYSDEGFLPEALLNFLARLSWGHGDDEIFDITQFIEWFDLKNVNHAPAKFNNEKLAWVNQQYIKSISIGSLIERLKPFLESELGIITEDVDIVSDPRMIDMVELFRDRVSTIKEMAKQMHYFFEYTPPSDELKNHHVTDENRAALIHLLKAFETTTEWNKENVHHLLQHTAKQFGLKMGKIGMPLRVLATGTTQTPSIDAVLTLIGQNEVCHRLASQLQ